MTTKMVVDDSPPSELELLVVRVPLVKRTLRLPQQLLSVGGEGADSPAAVRPDRNQRAARLPPLTL